MPPPAQVAYDHLAPDYDRRWARYSEATLRAALDGVELRGGDLVLDLAAGTGELARRLLARWPTSSVIGLDLSRAMLMRGAGKPDLRSWEPVQADSARLPFPDATFDRVLCANSFHYFARPESALDEIRRVLRPGASLVLVDWCDDYLACKLCSLYLRVRDPAFHRTYALRECRAMLEASGLEVTGAQRFKIDWLWGLMRLDAQRAAGTGLTSAP
jgi:ubiquinone/menaquinone biosynthesis C-methylase UbiE